MRVPRPYLVAQLLQFRLNFGQHPKCVDVGVVVAEPSGFEDLQDFAIDVVQQFLKCRMEDLSMRWNNKLANIGPLPTR